MQKWYKIFSETGSSCVKCFWGFSFRIFGKQIMPDYARLCGPHPPHFDRAESRVFKCPTSKAGGKCLWKCRHEEIWIWAKISRILILKFSQNMSIFKQHCKCVNANFHKSPFNINNPKRKGVWMPWCLPKQSQLPLGDIPAFWENTEEKKGEETEKQPASFWTTITTLNPKTLLFGQSKSKPKYIKLKLLALCRRHLSKTSPNAQPKSLLHPERGESRAKKNQAGNPWAAVIGSGTYHTIA